MDLITAQEYINSITTNGTLDDNKILIRELDNSNNWQFISYNLNFTDEQLVTWKSCIIWESYLIKHSISESIFLELNKEINFEKSIWSTLCKVQDLSQDFIINNLNNLNTYEIIKRKYLPIKFIAKYLIGEIKIGDGATRVVGSDCYPYTVIEINKDKTRIKIQSDNYELAEGFDYYSNQVYNYFSNPNGIIEELSLRKDGRWKEVGGSYTYGIGRRKYYQDPSF